MWLATLARAGELLRPDAAEAWALEPVAAEMAPWEDGFRTDAGPGSFEWWYVDTQLDGGATLVVNVLTRPIARWRGPLRPKVEITWTGSDGTTVREVLFPDAGRFSAARDRCDVAAGDTWLRGDLHTYTLHAEGERITADLTIHGVVPPWRPGVGKVWFDAARTEHLGWVVPVPRGVVDGVVTVDGVAARVTGTGYHDHNWGNVALDRVLREWIWGRSHAGPWTVLFFRGQGAPAIDGSALPLFLLARDDRIVMSSAERIDLSSALVLTKDGPRVPDAVTLVARDAHHVAELALTNRRMLEGESLLGTLPPPARAVAKLVMDPWYYRFEADLTLSVAGPDGGEADGRAVVEWMLFR